MFCHGHFDVRQTIHLWACIPGLSDGCVRPLLRNYLAMVLVLDILLFLLFDVFTAIVGDCWWSRIHGRPFWPLHAARCIHSTGVLRRVRQRIYGRHFGHWRFRLSAVPFFWWRRACTSTTRLLSWPPCRRHWPIYSDSLGHYSSYTLVSPAGATEFTAAAAAALPLRPLLFDFLLPIFWPLARGSSTWSCRRRGFRHTPTAAGHPVGHCFTCRPSWWSRPCYQPRCKKLLGFFITFSLCRATLFLQRAPGGDYAGLLFWAVGRWPL